MSSSRILLVDDMELNLVILKELLREGDFKTETACNGEEAVQLSRSIKFDLILMDIQMPILNGLEATCQIRGDKANLNNLTPIIALSANAYNSDRATYIEAGMNDVLLKPFDIAVFFQLLSIYLGDQLPDQPAKSLTRQTQLGMHAVRIDIDNLLRIGKNNRGFVGMMLQSFRDSSNEIIGEMGHSLERKDWAHTAQLVHKLKFALNVMGAGSLDEEVRWIETQTRNPKTEDEHEMQVRILAFITVISELYQHAGLLIESGEWN